jgi:hypothetical protein
MSTNDATDATENDKIRRIKELLRKHSAFLLDDGNL